MDSDVIEARYLRDHVVWLRFRDGTTGEVDLGPELSGEVFEPLRDPEYFKRFTIHPQCATLVWPNDVDIAPEFLHEAARRNPTPEPVARDSDTVGSFLMMGANGSGATIRTMPVVSRFLGIVISMYHKEHGPPHFHAAYGGYHISVEVESEVVRGRFPPRALRLVREWATIHRAALLENWESARLQQPLEPVPPLE